MNYNNNKQEHIRSTERALAHVYRHQRIKLGHASLPIGELGSGTNVVSLSSNLFRFSEHLFNLLLPSGQNLFQLFNDVAVIDHASVVRLKEGVEWG